MKFNAVKIIGGGGLVVLIMIGMLAAGIIFDAAERLGLLPPEEEDYE